jgi:hypothetical protein
VQQVQPVQQDHVDGTVKTVQQEQLDQPVQQVLLDQPVQQVQLDQPVQQVLLDQPVHGAEVIYL